MAILSPAGGGFRGGKKRRTMKQTTLITFSILLFLLPASVWADKVVGVVQFESGSPAGGVKVVTSWKNDPVYTDKKGRFEMELGDVNSKITIYVAKKKVCRIHLSNTVTVEATVSGHMGSYYLKSGSCDN